MGDKVPVVDHVLHLIGTVVAPVAGGLNPIRRATDVRHVRRVAVMIVSLSCSSLP